MSRRILLALLALLLAACGDDGAGAEPPASAVMGGFPVVVDGVEIPAAPQRIVSASASHTEILFAIGAGDLVIATDFFSNHPPAAEDTQKIDAFNVSVEAIADLDPDLVVLAFDPGDVVPALERLAIPTLLFDAPADLEDVYGQIQRLGTAVGRVPEAEALAAGLRDEIAEIVAGIPADAEPPTYYHELDPYLFTVTSSTFIGGLYRLLGLENVADPADADGFGYPQLTAEFLLAEDPDWIFLADTVCCAASAATLADRPGWDSLTAVREGRVVELDDDVASRWGPRIVDFLRTVAEAIGREGGR